MDKHLDEAEPKSSVDTNTKKKWTSKLRNTGGSGIIGPAYTGSYHYGKRPSNVGNKAVSFGSSKYAGKNADFHRDLIKLYTGEDTVGVKKLRNDVYKIGDKEVKADVFEGKILPTKLDGTPYRLPASYKEEFDNLIENDRTFKINTNDYLYRGDVYGPQTLDNVRHAVVKPVKDKNGNYRMKVTKLWDLSGSVAGGSVIDWYNRKQGGSPFVLEQYVPVTFDGDYTPEAYDIEQARRNVGKKKYGGNYQPHVGIIRKHLSNGGGIHIKHENRGKFTATMKRTGKTAEELSHSSNPLTRKRAIFALNARKWKH